MLKTLLFLIQKKRFKIRFPRSSITASVPAGVRGMLGLEHSKAGGWLSLAVPPLLDKGRLGHSGTAGLTMPRACSLRRKFVLETASSWSDPNMNLRVSRESSGE